MHKKGTKGKELIDILRIKINVKEKEEHTWNKKD